MDIDDILREVDPSSDSISPGTRDLQALTRRWVAERSAPELLDDRVRRQVEKVEDMTGDMDPKTNFALIVIQTELERYKFLVRSYLRVRVAKVPTSPRRESRAAANPSAQIDKHTLHYLSTQELRARLSPVELAYATRHQALLHNHYLSSFLASFPPQLQNLNDTAGNISMIDAPDLDAAVF
ncbi:DNA replication complex GINS protein SLD5, partial [Tolypocladium capitatum]